MPESPSRTSAGAAMESNRCRSSVLEGRINSREADFLQIVELAGRRGNPKIGELRAAKILLDDIAF